MTLLNRTASFANRLVCQTQGECDDYGFRPGEELQGQRVENRGCRHNDNSDLLHGWHYQQGVGTNSLHEEHLQRDQIRRTVQEWSLL